MKNKLIGILVSLLMVSSVSAIYCDDEQFQEWFDAGDLRADLNGDGNVTLTDVGLYPTVCEALPVVIVEEETSCGGSHSYHRDLSHNDYIRYYDNSGYNSRRVLLEGKEYYFDQTWTKGWSWTEFGWKINEDRKMTIRDSDFNVVTVFPMGTEGTFELSGETINYEISRQKIYSNRIKLWV